MLQYNSRLNKYVNNTKCEKYMYIIIVLNN